MSRYAFRSSSDAPDRRAGKLIVTRPSSSVNISSPVPFLVFNMLAMDIRCSLSTDPPGPPEQPHESLTRDSASPQQPSKRLVNREVQLQQSGTSGSAADIRKFARGKRKAGHLTSPAKTKTPPGHGGGLSFHTSGNGIRPPPSSGWRREAPLHGGRTR